MDITCLCISCEFVVARLFITFMFMSFEDVQKCSHAHKHYTFAKYSRYVLLVMIFTWVMSMTSNFRYCRPVYCQPFLFGMFENILREVSSKILDRIL